MAKITKDENTGITTFELESPEAFQAFQNGIRNDERAWRNHPETQELHTFKSENNDPGHVFVKYGEFSKRLER